MNPYKKLAIIELLILLGITGAIILWLVSNGSVTGNVSFITGK
ncbi:MAG: hypothetical protein Q7S33_04895 [Nanoarchaeota archaeon]|nr:hypothetical protein [Nanoarchaeota archaeon]